MERELWKFGGYGAALLIIITVPKAALWSKWNACILALLQAGPVTFAVVCSSWVMIRVNATSSDRAFLQLVKAYDVRMPKKEDVHGIFCMTSCLSTGKDHWTFEYVYENCHLMISMYCVRRILN
jgi:hypothetical protein